LYLLGEPLPIELMNSLHIDQDGRHHDVLAQADGVDAWTAAVRERLPAMTGGNAVTADPGVHRHGSDSAARAGRQLRDLRTALRDLAAEQTKDAQPQAAPTERARREAIRTLNRLSRTAPSWPELQWAPGGEPSRLLGASAAPGDLVTALIAHQAVDLFAGPHRDQLRACLAPGCDRYFLKQHPRRQWCTAACGNRARVARHYRRHQTATTPAGKEAGRGPRRAPAGHYS
jgi:predicted RNA-binding Zn ribbon-like protein